MSLNRPKKLVVVGQGYVGLPVAMRAVEVGFDVIGLDSDKYRIDALGAGQSYVGDVPDEQLSQALVTGRYLPTRSYEACAGFDFAVITVPTPLRETLPDLSFIEESARTLGPYLGRGATVVLESTTHPGTTEELLAPILEAASGLRVGTDFHLGYSPERIDPGNRTYNFVNTPKVISGVDEESLCRVRELYDLLVLQTVAVSSPREAELTKLLENTFRHVNIALVNELAVFAHQLGIDIWEAIDAASTKPFGYLRFTPGPGVGGHCLPVDPSYLSWQVRRTLGQNFRFVELANDVNDHMPTYVVQRLTHLLNRDSRAVRGSVVLLVGLAYKRGTGDIRESPALKVSALLHDLGARVLAVDPHVESYRWPAHVRAVQLTESVASEVDAAIILTAHPDLDLSALAKAGCPVLDTQRALSGPNVQGL